MNDRTEDCSQSKCVWAEDGQDYCHLQRSALRDFDGPIVSHKTIESPDGKQYCPLHFPLALLSKLSSLRATDISRMKSIQMDKLIHVHETNVFPRLPPKCPKNYDLKGIEIENLSFGESEFQDTIHICLDESRIDNNLQVKNAASLAAKKANLRYVNVSGTCSTIRIRECRINSQVTIHKTNSIELTDTDVLHNFEVNIRPQALEGGHRLGTDRLFDNVRIFGSTKVFCEKVNSLTLNDCTVHGSLEIDVPNDTKCEIRASNLRVKRNISIHGTSGSIGLNDCYVGRHLIVSSHLTALRIDGGKYVGRASIEPYQGDTNQCKKTISLSFKNDCKMTNGFRGDHLKYDAIIVSNCKRFYFLEISHSIIGSIHISNSDIPDIVLRKSKISDGINIAKCSVSGELSAPGDEDSPIYNLSVSDATLNSCDFSNRDFFGLETFQDVKFCTAPRFFQVSHSNSATFPIEIANYKNRDFASRTHYNALKNDMGKLDKRLEQGTFHALEQICLLETKKGRAAKFFGHCYRLSSEFGTNIGRLLLILGGSCVLFALVYASVASKCWGLSGCSIDTKIFYDSFLLACRNLFSPMRFLRDDVDLIPLALGITQSLMSIGLIADLVFALRWRFRRG